MGPYRLEFKNIASYMENCQFCNRNKCDGCPIPYNSSKKVQDILDVLKLEGNDTLFSDKMRVRGKEF